MTLTTTIASVSADFMLALVLGASCQTATAAEQQPASAARFEQAIATRHRLGFRRYYWQSMSPHASVHALHAQPMCSFAELDQAVGHLERGNWHDPTRFADPTLLASPDRLSQPNRQVLSRRLVHHAREVLHQHWPANNQHHATMCFRLALRLDSRQAGTELLSCVADRDRNPVARCAAIAIRFACLAKQPLHPALAAPALTLLGSADSATQQIGALILDNCVRVDANPEVLAAIHERALKILRGDTSTLRLDQYRGRASMLPKGPHSPNVPAQLLLTSSRFGSNELIRHIRGELEEHNNPHTNHAALLLECLAQLAPSMSQEQAALMFRPLSRFVFAPPHDNNRGTRALFGLHAAVESKLAELLDRFANESTERAMWQATSDAIDAIPEVNVRRLMRRKRGCLLPPRIAARYPGQLLEDWQQGHQVIAITNLRRAWREDPHRVLPFLATWPPEFAASLCTKPHHPLPLPILARLQLSTPLRAFRRALARSHAQAHHLPLLQRMANAVVADHETQVTIAARAHALGPAGRMLCRRLLRRLTEQSEQRAHAAALTCAAQLDVELPHWRKLADDLGDEHALALHAAQLQFGDSLPAIGGSTLAQLRGLFRNTPSQRVWTRLIPTASALPYVRGTMHDEVLVVVFAIAEGFETWPPGFAHFVAHQTEHARACIRLAAYSALASRSSALAELAEESALDSDPAVRAVAARQRRRNN